MEMGERNWDFPEYENMDDYELQDAYNELVGDDSISNEERNKRIARVDTLLSERGTSGWAETSFTSLPEPTDEDRAMLRISEFTYQKHGIGIDRRTDAWLELRRRIGITKAGNITFRKSAATYNAIAKDGDIVLKRGKDGKLEYNTAVTKQEATNEFIRIIEQGVKETRQRNATIAELPSMVKTVESYEDIPGLTAEENREMRGVVNPTGTVLPESRIGPNGALMIERRHFQKKLADTDLIIENSESTSEWDPTYPKLRERRLGLLNAISRIDEQIELEEVREEQEEDVSRLTKIKKYLKENALGLSAFGISVATLITSIAIAARGAVVKGAQATGDFGKWLADKLKNLPSWLASLGSLLVTLLKAGAAGVSWLSKNLWAVVVFVLLLLYDYIRERRRRRRRGG